MSDGNPIAIALLAALRDEAAFVSHAVHVTGMGPRRLCDAIDRLQPRAVLLIGFAGGLNPSLRAGDVLRVGRVMHEGDEPIALGGDATLLTVDAPADSPALKRSLHERTRADAVDMETYHVARFCRERGVALDVVRAVSDPADAALLRQSVHWVKPDGSRRLSAVLGHLVTHPHHLPALVRLGRDAGRAAKALGHTLSAWPNA